jgi:hypothetical protein
MLTLFSLPGADILLYGFIVSAVIIGLFYLADELYDRL